MQKKCAVRRALVLVAVLLQGNTNHSSGVTRVAANTRKKYPSLFENWGTCDGINLHKKPTKDDNGLEFVGWTPLDLGMIKPCLMCGQFSILACKQWIDEKLFQNVPAGNSQQRLRVRVAALIHHASEWVMRQCQASFPRKKYELCLKTLGERWIFLLLYLGIIINFAQFFCLASLCFCLQCCFMLTAPLGLSSFSHS